MFESIFVLASYGFFQGGGVGSLLNYLEEAGFFSYVLPFLLIFALVFATLSSMALFKANKGVSGVIAFCVGLLALQFDVVPLFFSEIFPRVGIALSVMLAALIILGLFIPTAQPAQKVFHYLLLIMAFIAFLIVLFQQTYSTFFYDIFYFFSPEIFAWAMMVLIVIVLVVLIVKPTFQRQPLPNINHILFYPQGGQQPAGGP